jgi:hypothetical protein
MEIGGMSLSEFESRHTMSELQEIAALSQVQRDEKARDERIKRVERQAQANRSQG